RPAFTGSLDHLRPHIFPICKTDIRDLPPTDNAFKFHIRRAFLQCPIYKTAHLVRPNIPDIIQFGRFKKDGYMCVKFQTNAIANSRDTELGSKKIDKKPLAGPVLARPFSASHCGFLPRLHVFSGAVGGCDLGDVAISYNRGLNFLTACMVDLPGNSPCTAPIPKTLCLPKAMQCPTRCLGTQKVNTVEKITFQTRDEIVSFLAHGYRKVLCEFVRLSYRSEPNLSATRCMTLCNSFVSTTMDLITAVYIYLDGCDLIHYTRLFHLDKSNIWVAVWSIICFMFTIFALITFMIQPKRFRWPARPILYLISCGFVTCTIYLIRWIEGPYTCAGVSLLEKPAESLSCVGISLILLFCDLAYSLWWCIFCFVWFLSAMKEWSTEAIEKISTRLHTTVWIFSAIPMFYILMSNNISINYLSGFCEVKTPALVLFQLFFMLVSCALAILMLIALRNVRNTLLLAGRSPEKLERLFYRLLIISLGIFIPHFVYLICQFYDTFAVALFKLVLRKISIIFSTLWVYSPKTFEMWNELICFCKRTRKCENSKGSICCSYFVPNLFRSRETTPKIGNNNSPLMPQNKTGEEKKTIFGLFFSKNNPQPLPVSRVTPYIWEHSLTNTVTVSCLISLSKITNEILPDESTIRAISQN
ncbi:hypothetical protein NQ315_016109, partial [Exocentrus adspersus]